MRTPALFFCQIPKLSKNDTINAGTIYYSDENITETALNPQEVTKSN